MKKLFTALLVLTLTSCGSKPQITSNKTVHYGLGGYEFHTVEHDEHSWILIEGYDGVAFTHHPDCSCKYEMLNQSMISND